MNSVSDMILSLIKFSATPSRRKAILELLRFVEGQIQVKTGCSDCAVYEKCDQRNSIIYVEQWQSKEELNHHIRSDLYRGILAAMELSSERPEISFHEVSETKGIELIDGLRT
jgi:quinol monooxygenase YgiN